MLSGFASRFLKLLVCDLPSRRPRRRRSFPAMVAMVEKLESRELLSTSWYVSPSGSTSNPGTLAAPFKTIQQAANVAEQNSKHAIDMAQKLAHELRAAQQRISELEAEVVAYQNQAERAEQATKFPFVRGHYCGRRS